MPLEPARSSGARGRDASPGAGVPVGLGAQTGAGGAPAGVTVSLQSVQQVRTDLRSTGRFETSNGLIDRIHDNTSWALQENNVGAITTDTPIYEKNGWTGDAQLMAGTFSILFDTERLYAKQIQDMLDAQNPTGGSPQRP